MYQNEDRHNKSQHHITAVKVALGRVPPLGASFTDAAHNAQVGNSGADASKKRIRAEPAEATGAAKKPLGTWCKANSLTPESKTVQDVLLEHVKDYGERSIFTHI